MVDGGSTDGTLDIVRSFSCSGAVNTVLISEPDGGIYDALNKGIALASGQVIGFLHADDVFASPEVLMEIHRQYQSDPSLAAVYGNLQYVDRRSANLVLRSWHSSSFSMQKLMLGWMPPHPTLYLKREWYRKIGGFDKRYKISADYYFILELFSSELFFSKYINQNFIKMRVGGLSNRSIGNIFIKMREDFSALSRFGAGTFRSVLIIACKNLFKLSQINLLSYLRQFLR